MTDDLLDEGTTGEETGAGETRDVLGDMFDNKIPDDEPADDEAIVDDVIVDDKTPEPRKAPNSWMKEQHERWGKIDKDTQDYIELREKQMADGLGAYKEHHEFGANMRKVFDPYRAHLQSQGVDEAKATQFLLNAHYNLSTAQPAVRQQLFAKLAKDYGVDLAGLTGGDEVRLDPNVKALQDRLSQLEGGINANQQAAQNEAQAKIARDIEAFTADGKHPYFDECSEDIITFIEKGHTLEQAYAKAVRSNEVTNAKELARLQADNEKALRGKSKTEAESARKAAAANVKGRDTRKAPTELIGTMDDTMRETLKEIRSRTH